LQVSLIFLIITLVALVAAGWWLLNARQSSVPKTILPPYTIRKSLLERHERAYQDILRQVTGDNMIIFAKVNLGYILNYPGNHADFRVHWSRAQRRSVDFLLCDLDLKPRLAIKFDPNPGRRRKNASKNAREDILKDSLDAAELQLLIVKPAESYQLEEVRFRIKYALARQDSMLHDDGLIVHDADLDDDEFADSIFPKFKRWTSDLWQTAARHLH